MPPPAQCPQCQATDSFVAVGPGVERLEQEAAELFPSSRILVLSSDLVESVERLREELDDIAQGRFDIVIGTQLVAKGHHFPKLNLVGVIDADLGLANGDPRAAERTFQLLHQVTGRAGREEGRGIGYLQTHQPEHPVMRALVAADRDAFYTSEIELREKTHYPPFGRLASLLISAGERPAAESYARRLAAASPFADEVRVLGPAEAPLAVVRGRYRFRLLVKSPRAFDLSGYLRDWLAAAPKPHGQYQARRRRRPAELSLAAAAGARPHRARTGAGRACRSWSLQPVLERRGAGAHPDRGPDRVRTNKTIGRTPCNASHSALC